jgi:hypothetical protein
MSSISLTSTLCRKKPWSIFPTTAKAGLKSANNSLARLGVDQRTTVDDAITNAVAVVPFGSSRSLDNSEIFLGLDKSVPFGLLALGGADS